mgnify:CR=1 FL=1|tara:strand:- start:712 stop:1215 length:504 start_codon:yes stop_codon:yes gene_type:complete
MPLITRTDKGSPLSISEMDGNLDYCSPGTYLEVDIPMGVAGVSGILGMGTVPIELLPALATGNYYQFVITLEYTHNITSYTNVSSYLYIDAPYQIFNESLIGNNLNRVITLNSEVPDAIDTVENITFKYPTVPTPKAVSLGTYDSADPTLGDGTLKAKIWYTVRTFG